MGETSEKNNGHNNDEINLFELFEALWQGKVLILIITLITLSIGLLYNFSRVIPTPVYKVSTQALQKNNISTSIILSKLWITSPEADLAYFSTQGMEKYSLGSNPYSPNALFIRALQKANSLEEKSLYLKEKIVKLNLNITFPKKISDTFEISTTTKNLSEVENLKLKTKEYIKWSQKRFEQSLLEEANLLNNNFQESSLSAPFYISEIDIVVIDRSKTNLVIILSTLLGLLMGTAAVLLKISIQARHN